jgi:hypothetical protein
LWATAQTSDLVAAYGFNETSGSTVIDASGNNNTGTLSSGVTRSTQGKFGSALIFNGTSALVTIPDSPSLHLTTAMTLEAWVKPSAVTSAWRDVIYKGNDNYFLEATSDNVLGCYRECNVLGCYRECAGQRAPRWTHARP